ncbi:MAG: tetratricopeptide repeat protein [Acidobacteriota bacterium]|nr:tetratricopeptide repeat protein [Acidobacteriota bacterium]
MPICLWFVLILPGWTLPAAALPEIESVAAGGLDTRAAALLLSGQEGGDLPSAVAAFPRPAEKSGAGGVDLIVDLAGGGLLEGLAEDQPLIVEIYAYALDQSSEHGGPGSSPGSGGGVRGYLTQAFFIEDEELRSQLASVGVKFLGHLPLPPGTYSLRVMVLHRRADRFSLEVLPVRVPGLEAPVQEVVAPQAGEAAAGASEEIESPAPPPPPPPPLGPRPRTAEDPMLLESAEPWILVRRSGMKSPGAAPWVVGQQRWVPAARPVLAGEEPRPVLSTNPDLSLRILDPVDRQVLWQGTAVAKSEAEGDEFAGRRWLELPATGLGPGEYLLQAGEESQEAEPLEVQIATVGPGMAGEEGEGRGRVGPWFALQRGRLDTVASADLGAPPAADPVGTPEDGSRAIQQAYLEALLALGGELPGSERTGSEQTGTARETVAAFERAQMAGGTPRRQNRLAQAEVQAVLQMVQLANGDSTAVATLVWLHEQLYRDYHHRKEYLLAVHSRSQVLRLGQIYVQRTPDGREAGRTLAAALVSMAGYLQEVGSNLSAAQTYDQALELSRDYPPALLGLAVLREAYGEYDEAVKLLRRMIRRQPENSEARLRLGVNLRRSGNSRQADEILRRCLGEDNPRWVRTIAYQELAELAVAEERPAEAVELLRQGLAELPGEARLAIQLAAVLDRLGRSAQASAVLEDMEALGVSRRPSARFRYGRWPRASLLQARRMLREQGREHLPRMVDLVERLVRYRQGGEDGEEASP